MSNYYFLMQDEQKALLTWHRWLNGDDGDRGGNRGDRARLRRAEAPEDILLTDAFFRFLHQMPDGFPQKLSTEQRLPVAAAIAGLLAHVETNNAAESFATQLAKPTEGKSKAPMSELRFQQLQKSPTVEDFYRRMLRAIRLLGKSTNVLALTNDIIHWHKEFSQPLGRHPKDRLAVRWATDYFSVPTPKN
ncbi:type I-E CRISPR-associated protein Cse2/CasB [Methylomonas rosea]|uniref:Type I-E CRISPR-associated protein Cse2/CasB n=1 Tax=Methylomonas rosea TaxID=2952227 RepID=A0ABT1TWB2_9GAMM|nr:type I-E CRISPR-associated protein Cse2/CasB [Methylomonas sp. WSC-7]MCQ8119039.1 type I-E CRISPR-associated protein Cse2/CasB [Methylomonas sp. WSC-7]